MKHDVMLDWIWPYRTVDDEWQAWPPDLNNVFKMVGFYDTKKIIPRDGLNVFVKLVRPTGTFFN
jgi:hypothetical protein